MRYRATILSALMFLGLATNAVHAGESKAVQTMAGILEKLNHFPNEADKASLQQIADDKGSSADEKTLAHALMHVQHKVSDGDKPKLEAIVNSKKASAGAKTIANVIL